MLAAMKRVRAEHATTPEKARQFLIDEGYLEKDGTVNPVYTTASARLEGNAKRSRSR